MVYSSVIFLSTNFEMYVTCSFYSCFPHIEDVVVHEFATLCLASLSVDFTCKVQIFDHNGLEPLLRLLSSPDPDVKKNSVECIFNLVQVGQHVTSQLQSLAIDG